MRPLPPIRTLAAAALLALGAGAAAAVEPAGPQFRVTQAGTDGDITRGAGLSDVAHNTRDNEYLVVWQRFGPNDTEIGARRYAADGTPLGNPFFVSEMGPPGNPDFIAEAPAVAYNPNRNEYLVAWHGDDVSGVLVDDEFEIWAQRLAANGTKVGPEIQISDMGPDSTPDYGARWPRIAHNAAIDEYLITWIGDDDIAPVVNDEEEVFAQRLTGDGLEAGTDFKVSTQGNPAATPAIRTMFGPKSWADVVWAPGLNRYLVAWAGDSSVGNLVDEKPEVYTQLLRANGSELGPERRLSFSGADTDPALGANNPDLAYDPARQQFVVTWWGVDGAPPQANGEFEIYSQRVGAGGMGLGAPKRITSWGPPGDAGYLAALSRGSYNSGADEYLVTWIGTDTTPSGGVGAFEIFAQRFDPGGDPLADPLRVSRMGSDDADPTYGPLVSGDNYGSAVAYSPQSNEYLVTWFSDDDSGALADNESEVYARRLKGGVATPPPTGTPPGGGIPGTTGAPAAPNCAPELVISSSGGGGTIQLTAGQLKINQNIGSAAVRRANAIESWLNDGIVGGDICGGALAPEQFHPGVAYTTGPLNPLATIAAPRPLSIPAAADKGDVEFELSTAQLRINQRIYSAAVRRANALKERIEGKLTGGDLTDGTLAVDRARQDVYLGTLTPATPAPAASISDVDAPSNANATFTLTAEQLAINQRIAQAAVRRTNELRVLLSSGLTGENFADGSITAQDWASAP